MPGALWVKKIGHNPSFASVVLLGGAYSTSASWSATFTDKLSRSVNVVCMDYRDTGRNAHGVPPFTLDDMKDDVVHTMVTHRLRNVYLFGASMGGTIALNLARSHPEMVAGLCTFAATPEKCFDPKTLSGPTLYALDRMRVEKRLNDGLYTRKALSLRHPHEPAVVDAILRHGYNPSAGHGAAFLNAEPITDWDSIQSSVLVVHGTHDQVFPVDHAWRLHHLLPRSKLRLLPNVGHWMPTDETEIDFLVSHVVDHVRACTK